MLQKLRRLSKSWISSIFLGGLALSFGVWGIADIFRGNVDTSVAAVGGDKIPADVFQRDYRNFLRNEGSQLGHAVSAEEAHAKGLDRQSLQMEISRTAIDKLTAQYGIRTPDAQVSSSIRAIAAFKGPLGSFDRQTFEEAISRAGFTEDSFVAIERQDLAREQLLLAVHDGFQLPQGYTHFLFDYLNEQRAADYVVVPENAAGSPRAPSDADLTAYVKSHAAQFSTPEYRDVTYAAAGPQDVMNKVHVTDEELKQQYELRRDQYQIAEKRDVDQITFPDEASAKAARTKIDAGTGFADLAKQRGLKSEDTSLGTVVEADLGNDRGPPTFALPSGGVTQPIKSTFGWVLLHVNKITPGLSRSFADVKDSLRKDVLNQLASAKLTDVANAFDDASASGDSLAQAAARAGMRVVHVPAVDKNGMTPEGTKASLPASPDFLAQLQKSDVGEEGDPFPSSDGNVYVIKVNGVIPPRLKPLASVRAAVAAAWTADDQKQRLSQMAGRLVREAQTGKSLSPIAAKLHASVQSTGAVGRDAKTAALSPELVRALFAAKPGSVVTAPTAKGDGLVIARITGVQHPASLAGNPYFLRFGQSLSGQTASDFDTTLAMAARARLGVTINQQQADRVTGGS